MYIINDPVCKFSSVGCTSESIKVRFGIRVTLSMIDALVKFRVTMDNRALHSLDRSSTNDHRDFSSEQLEIIIVLMISFKENG